MKVQILFAVAFTASLGTVSSTASCNIANAGQNAGMSCVKDWVNSVPIRQTSVDLGAIITAALSRNGIGLCEVNSFLKNFLNTSVDPLEELIEAGLLVEPYLVYALADVIVGFPITANDLKLFHLPRYLSNRQHLVELYSRYFNESCESMIATPFIDCFSSWMDANCDKEQDKTQKIIDALNHVRDFFCQLGHPGFEQELAADLGNVYSVVFKRVAGLYKDPSSPFLFNVKINETEISMVGEKFMTKCFPLVSDSLPELMLIVSEDSTIGIGEAYERLLKLGKPLILCAMNSAKEVYPELFAQNQPLLKHLSWLAQQMGLTAEEIGLTPATSTSAVLARELLKILLNESK